MSLRSVWNSLVSLMLGRPPKDIAIVRRYVDMNGRYVGEFYVDRVMAGASLDNLPLDCGRTKVWRLDASNSFLEPMGWRTVRVGGTEPADDPWVRRWVKTLPSIGVELRVENNFATELGKGAV